MSYWMWFNLSLAAVFFAAIVGIPLWMVLKHPDVGPKVEAELAHAWKRSRTTATEGVHAAEEGVHEGVHAAEEGVHEGVHAAEEGVHAAEEGVHAAEERVRAAEKWLANAKQAAAAQRAARQRVRQSSTGNDQAPAR